MEGTEESGPRTASMRPPAEEGRELVTDWNPSIEMTQAVHVPTGPDQSIGGAVAMALSGDYLFENIPAMIWIKDRENNLLKVNRWAAKAMGVEPADLEGKSEWDLHPDRADEYYADDRKVIKSKKPIYGIVEQVMIDNGEDLWVVTDKIPVLDGTGEVRGIVVITRDISRQKEAETKLVESQERFELALWGAEMGSWDLDLSGEKFNLDGRAARILGFSEEPASVLFDDLIRLVHPDDLEGMSGRLKDHLEDATPVFEAEWRIADGTDKWRWIAQKGKVTRRASSGTPLRLSGTVLDVTPQKEMEMERRDLEHQMQHTQKLESLGVLAGGIAHDFNNLLTGILSQSGIARIELGKGTGNIDDNLEKIEAAARRMAQLTRQMLAYSGRGKFEIRKFNLNEVIHEIVFLLKASIRKKAKYAMELCEEAPFNEGDAAQIHQVLLNLVTNASDAIGENQGTVVLRTGFADLDAEDLRMVPWGEELKPGRFTYVEVEDDGCGMDEETQKRLFEPFFTTKFTGRGLGMSAVLGIVRSHGGLIKVKTAPGVGTIFRVYTPAVDAPEEEEQKDVSIAASPSTAGSKFLIIDDEQVVRTVFTQALRGLGHELDEADDGPPALELFKRRLEADGEHGAFDGVFLDMTMPQMNGHEVFQELRALDPDVPICIMSGYTEDEIAKQFEKEKVAAFLPKPFELADIEKAILKMQRAA